MVSPLGIPSSHDTACRRIGRRVGDLSGDALDAYSTWPEPSLIGSDGAYGVGGFPGDPRTPDDLGEWYEPHVEAWAKHAPAYCTLWFWNTELGWANVHPLLDRHGWDYVQTIVWDKGSPTSRATSTVTPSAGSPS